MSKEIKGQNFELGLKIGIMFSCLLHILVVLCGAVDKQSPGFPYLVGFFSFGILFLGFLLFRLKMLQKTV